MHQQNFELSDYLETTIEHESLKDAINHLKNQLSLWMGYELSTKNKKLTADEINNDNFTLEYAANAKVSGSWIIKHFHDIAFSYNYLHDTDTVEGDFSDDDLLQYKKYLDRHNNSKSPYSNSHFGFPKSQHTAMLRNILPSGLDIYNRNRNEHEPKLKTDDEIKSALIEAYCSIIIFDSNQAKVYRETFEQHGYFLASEFANILKTINSENVDLSSKIAISNGVIRNYILQTETFINETRKQEVKISSLSTDFDNKINEALDGINNKRSDFEKLITDQLRLSKPVEAWDDAARELACKVYWSLAALVSVILLGVSFYGWLFYSWDYDRRDPLSLNTLSSTTFLLIISASYFYLIKVFSRILFSSLHLERDAKERKYLTHVYLSLIAEGGAVDESSRDTVLRALFSRSSSGLLGGDSAPTMPISDIIRSTGNIVKNKDH